MCVCTVCLQWRSSSFSANGILNNIPSRRISLAREDRPAASLYFLPGKVSDFTFNSHANVAGDLL